MLQSASHHGSYRPVDLQKEPPMPNGIKIEELPDNIDIIIDLAELAKLNSQEFSALKRRLRALGIHVSIEEGPKDA